MRAWLSGKAAIVLAAFMSLGMLQFNQANAQDARRTTSIERQVYECFDRGEYTRAVELIQDYLKYSPNDAGMIYNLACAHSRLSDFDAAASDLLRAFKAGFRDIEHMRHDPDLAALRQHPTYKAILEQADRIAADSAKTAVERWREKYGVEHYRYETDKEHRINYATALDETSHKEMREMLDKQADQMIKSLFDQPPAYYVLIAVPTPEDSDKFFNGNASIGGMYQHDQRRLVARDIGGSLRHEFFHLMHYGHMERLHQQHPLWVQEGLASLYEDYELHSDGSIKFLPNDRQLTVKGRSKAGSLVRWKDLFGMNAESFMDKARQMYPQVRSIFEFVADQGKLEKWYRSYVDHFDEDRSGAKAFEIAFGVPVADVEKQWRRWIAEQPEIDLQIRSDDAALGIRSRENASNDGVLITEVIPGSAADRGKLRRDDVIVALDGQSTRNLMALRKIIASKHVGDEVDVRARRNGEYFNVKVVLRPAFSGA
jgi:tetratricopeptide (TPR) repeat protein